MDKYLALYNDTAGVTCSACDLSKADSLATAVSGLAADLKAGLSDAAALQLIQSVRSKVQSYEVADNIDLVDFCSLLAKAGAGKTITTACQNVVKEVKTSYVLKQGYKGAAVENSNGLAIYFPLQSVSPCVPRAGIQQENRLGRVPKSLSQAIRNR